MRRLQPYRCVLSGRIRRMVLSPTIHLPANVDIGVHAGTFHNLTFPDQLPVASILLLGENRTCAIGRWSPICEPKFAKL
jgi:hypothetical protein